MSDYENQPQRDIHFSKKIRAGKRTYYFDVKSTRNNDYYLTITESKRMPGETEDRPFFEKHKLFLYKEDFEKFTDGLLESLEYIRGSQPPIPHFERTAPSEQKTPSNGTLSNGTEGNSFSDVNFDDLGK